jgi:hypothetical protein
VSFKYNASDEVQEHWAKYHETYTGGAVNLLKRFGDDVITIVSEEMIKNPTKELKRLCKFLSVSCSSDYLKDCSSIVNTSPSRSRHTILWTQKTKEFVSELIKKTSMLHRYSFEE